MAFNSLLYPFFFLACCLIYFSIGQRLRTLFLVAASFYFYSCWKFEYLTLLCVSTFVDYLCGLGISRYPVYKRWFLGMSLTVNLGLLFIFKYYDFFRENVTWLTGSGILPDIDVLLPVGISFYTFQTLSYTIDVYLGKQRAEKCLIQFAAYVSFFPQLVAGPIERSTHLLPQFKLEKTFEWNRFKDGLLLILWGFFKKIVIADKVALVVNHVYGLETMGPSFNYVVATYAFAIQIYCDFSGYSDIAIGSAKILGFDLMTNFKAPYFSTSVSEFWKRWHISLFSWFRDYIYIPLGGNRKGSFRHYTNLMVVFFISGLWHGASWHFIVWGLMHGIILVVESMIPEWKSRSKSGWVNFFKWVLTFHLVLVSWVFFRADTVAKAVEIISSVVQYQFDPRQLGVTSMDLMFCGVFICILMIVDGIIYFCDQKALCRRILKEGWSMWCFILLIIVLYFGVFNSDVDFIYFQF